VVDEGLAVGEVAMFGGGVLVVVMICRLVLWVVFLFFSGSFPALTGCAWGRVGYMGLHTGWFDPATL
jgi:hypothetical protein